MSDIIVEKALSCLGKGFDITSDFRLNYCKGDGRLVILNETQKSDLVVPGFKTVENVSVDIKCDKGDRTRYQSDILEFNQMSELFNRKNSLPGKIPSGLFNSMFGFDSSSWAKDASSTKCLALDGHYINFFKLHINRYPLLLNDEVRNAVPTTWDPISLARFIENYGTHVIVAISVGGQDLVLVRQDQSSNLQPSDLKKHLNDLGDQLFTGTCTLNLSHSKNKDYKNKVPEAFNVFDAQSKLFNSFSSVTSKDGITVICSKRGGDASISSHCEWLQTVPLAPDAIHFSFIPITCLLKCVPGIGFLSHAINLYLRYKPPIADLQHFLDFQSHKLWAPVHNDLPLGPATNRVIHTPVLHFNPVGPKLFVNTTQVIVGRRPVTGMRLYLEGMKSNRLATHLEHLSSIPKVLQNKIDGVTIWKGSDDVLDERYFEPIQWKKCSHVYTAPIEYEPTDQITGKDVAFIVTGAQLRVEKHESKNLLHLLLLFSRVSGAYIGKSTWEQGSISGDSLQKSSFLSTLSTSILGNSSEKEKPNQIVIDSAVFPTGPPPPPTQKLLRYVDMSHLCKGPQHSPGYWIVTGAKLDLEMGKICLHVKFSLLCFST
ncbi:hypothetical protein AQUCO_00201275v1 [Aquilegia coerulea]|uniref:MACPF domain-containing protein n=1 Tax=Aquilegia coerulea TaxID=218851 RepID=A0A2G5F765_AQUCA|nr:hypothetical protein AQUCO_00201275v1 [Aquilegia coerulea]